METIKKIVAYPAFVSSCLAARVCPEKAEETGWDGTFDLDRMYRTGYVFGAAVWGILIAAAVVTGIALT